MAFLLGGLTRMPAVQVRGWHHQFFHALIFVVLVWQAFAFYSAAAIVADYFLQITCFTAVMILDARRTAVRALFTVLRCG